MPVETINNDTCIGCGTCVDVCPMDVFRLKTVVEDNNVAPPCQAGCPLGVNQRAYFHLINNGMLEEAAEALREYHPAPAITGRLCPHPCETVCSRAAIDEAVNINGLEEYIGDYILNNEIKAPAQIYKAKVAIIGSGPAGLSAAYFLANTGYEVTVFDKNDKPGGLLRNSIPAFRLPEDVLDKQIAAYEKMGIVFKTGVTFGKDITKEKLEKDGYSAFIAATGAAKPMLMNVPGADAAGITTAIDVLARVKAGAITELKGKVAVIGGGSVVLDAARTALRLGAEEVNVVCLEQIEPGTENSMLALTDEIEDALAEGVKIHAQRGVKSFTTANGKVTGIQCVECLQVRNNGVFAPIYGEPIDQEIAADTVIMAIGQGADASIVPEPFATNERGYIIADEKTKEVSPGFFAVGDAVSGPTTIVVAFASGKRAAQTVDRYLRGVDLLEGLEEEIPVFENDDTEEILNFDRTPRRKLSSEQAKKSFAESVHPYNDHEAALEAERCLNCGSRAEIVYQEDCQICHLCRLYCPVDAITITSGKCAEPIVGL
jgi:NADPH-dependent glutamate synthase beta subunit-like oxidoreductase